MNTQELMVAIRAKKDELLGREAERDLLAKQLGVAEGDAIELTELLGVQDAAQAFLRLLAEHQQELIKKKIEMLVTYGLRTVFDADVQFRVTLDTRGNQIYMGFVIEGSSGEQVPLMDAEGGGLVVLAAFLLRVVLLLMTRPKLATMLVQDEPLTQLSECYREPAAQLIRRLVDKGLVRILAVTHDPVLAAAADTRYRFGLKGGKTVVSRIEEDRG